MPGFLDQPVQFRLEKIDVSLCRQDQKTVCLTLNPIEAASTYEYLMDRQVFVQWLSDELDRQNLHPYREILEALKRIENHLSSD